jgi:hypothetical protein
MRNIRILELYPGTKGSTISCKLSVQLLDNDFDFVALSYVWGNPHKIHEISCNDHQFFITKNLHEALQQLRSPTKTLRLWVDAICIDQTNNKERESQVRLMGEIYRRAPQVHVWLGLDDENVARGFALIQTISSVSKSYQGDRMSYGDLTEAGIPAPEHDDWKALESLFWREWWTRMWVVQEICVSRKALFICGSATMDARDVFESTDFIEHSAISVTTGIYTGSAKFMANLRQNYIVGNDLGLLSLLIKTRSFAVSDYHDKIYALLGICSTHEAQSTISSYEMPYQQLYHSIVVQHLQQGSLDILTAVCDPCWRDASFTPSWVPDWTMTPQVTEFLRPSNEISASASNGCSTDIRFSSDGSALLAKGALIDTVAQTHKPYFFQSMDERRIRNDPMVSLLPDNWIEQLGGETLIRMGIRLLCWERAALKLETYSNEEPLMAFLRTITADTITDLDIKALYNSFCMVQMFIRPDGELDLTDLKNSCVFSKAFYRASWGRTMFITKQGYMGIGPYTIKSGDKVVILKGGKTPYILRKKRDHHVFVGECYVHGIMHGEAFGVDVNLETFAIK